MDQVATTEADAYRNSGAHCREVLAWMHRYLRPRAYMEIGVHTGGAFVLSRCPSIAIDPSFHATEACMAGKPVSMFFQMTADQFFRDYNPVALLGSPLDFSFIDGMHLFEWVLRDFINVERVSAHRGVIALHDCVPPDRHFIRRDVKDMRLRDGSRYPDGHGGDVWKIVPLLRKHRPDLRVHCFDSDPSGLVFVTGLDADSRTLADNYFAIIEEARQMELTSIRDLIASLNVLPTKQLATPEGAARFFAPAM